MSEEFPDGDFVYIKGHEIRKYFDCPGGYYKIGYRYDADTYIVNGYPEDTYYRYRAGIKYMRKITEFERIMLNVGKV